MSTPGFVSGAWEWIRNTLATSNLQIPVQANAGSNKPVPAVPKADVSEELNSGLSGWVARQVLGLLQLGRIPKHVAFIMDGNRRFARTKGLRAEEGHRSGFSTLVRMLECCSILGVRTVTVYAFSIENFKRPKHEVDFLMQLSAEVFERMEDKIATIERHRVRVRILGDLTLLPSKVQKAAARVMKSTQHYDRMTLNICFSYTSSEEIQRSFSIAKQLVVEKRVFSVNELDERLLSTCMYTRGDHPELLVRTSGESRLSDFLTWQCKDAHLKFVDVNWPQLTWRHMVLIILDFQVNCSRDPCDSARSVIEEKVIETLEQQNGCKNTAN